MSFLDILAVCTCKVKVKADYLQVSASVGRPLGGFHCYYDGFFKIACVSEGPRIVSILYVGINAISVRYSDTR